MERGQLTKDISSQAYKGKKHTKQKGEKKGEKRSKTDRDVNKQNM